MIQVTVPPAETDGRIMTHQFSISLLLIKERNLLLLRCLESRRRFHKVGIARQVNGREYRALTSRVT